MRYDIEKGRNEELYIDWQIASTKAAVCLRRARSEHDPIKKDYWFDLADLHLRTANGLLREVDRIRELVDCDVDYVGANQLCRRD